eukprot:SAG22_NODE_1403_length_4492_cov_13.784430_1_plen_263_part_10
MVPVLFVVAAALQVAVGIASPAAQAPPPCPAGASTRIAEFQLEGDSVPWAACEDLQRRDGALVLVSAAGAEEWFTKGYEPYTQGGDEDYYLNLTKAKVMSSKADILAVELLSKTHLTYELVKQAVPPMVSTGVRTFVGSRAASVDTTFSDMGDDASGYGFPSVSTYVINKTAAAAGEPPILDMRKYLNVSHIADGMVGGHLPIARFVFPISGSARYWDMIAAGVPDMKGSREQGVWFRFQQVDCSSAAGGGGAAAAAAAAAAA